MKRRISTDACGAYALRSISAISGGRVECGHISPIFEKMITKKSKKNDYRAFEFNKKTKRRW